MRAIATLMLALLAVNACASNPPAPTYKVYAIPGRPAPVERVTPELWADAQAQAARLSGGLLSLSRAAPAQLVHLPIGQLCDLLGRCPHAAAYDRVHQVTYLRNDRPWASDHGHSFGILIHEAAHSLQPDSMSPDCREAQDHRSPAGTGVTRLPPHQRRQDCHPFQ